MEANACVHLNKKAGRSRIANRCGTTVLHLPLAIAHVGQVLHADGIYEAAQVEARLHDHFRREKRITVLQKFIADAGILLEQPEPADAEARINAKVEPGYIREHILTDRIANLETGKINVNAVGNQALGCRKILVRQDAVVIESRAVIP